MLPAAATVAILAEYHITRICDATVSQYSAPGTDCGGTNNSRKGCDGPALPKPNAVGLGKSASADANGEIVVPELAEPEALSVG